MLLTCSSCGKRAPGTRWTLGGVCAYAGCAGIYIVKPVKVMAPMDERLAAAAMLLGVIRTMIGLNQEHIRELLDFRDVETASAEDGTVVGLQINLGSGPFILTITPVR